LEYGEPSQMKIILKNADETRALGKKIATRLRPGMVISLEGPLGAGKTTLLQGIAQGLGIKQKMTSPTFILFRVLPVKKRSIKWLVHGDAYRVKRPAEMTEAGLHDYLDDLQTVTIIEWGDLVKNVLKKAVRIKLAPTKKGEQRSAEVPKALLA
jgi:tRNA threonylcarbamoyladenosine biosynthesis protein TsaE